MMTNSADNLEDESAADNPATESGVEQYPPVWLCASLADLVPNIRGL